MLRFEVEGQTAWGEKLAVVGDGPLGGWSVEHCLVLEAAAYPTWSGAVALSGQPLEYKYAIVRPPEEGGGGQLVRWEFDGSNRRLVPDTASEVFLTECFGDRSYRSLRTGETEAKAADGCPADPPSEAAEGAAAEGAAAPRVASGVLGALDVEPRVRCARLVRSRSGATFDHKYELLSGSVLGTGMSGGVCLARARAGELEVAVKTLPTSGLTESQREQALAEIQNQLSMDHPNICRLFEIYEEPMQLRLVLERLRGPDLYEHWSRQGRYSERDAANCILQICSAVAYCHSRGVCHRDLKLENFCLEDDSENARIKMIDFGLSSVTSTPMTDAVGTLYYVAPEVLRGAYDEKCDMWSLGVLTYIMLTGQAPFKGYDDRDTVRRIRKGAYTLPVGCLSPSAKDFIQSLLQLEPAARLDAKAALAHDWLADAEADAPGVPLDGGVLEGLRAFTRSNAVRRAFLSVVAPVSTAKEVSRWADQFAAMDKDGTGTLSVKDLAARLQAELSTSEAEAAKLSAALTGVDGGEMVSYSAFLSACLATHVAAFEGGRIREFFERLDKDSAGCVSVKDVESALGDGSEIEELREWLSDTGAGDRVSYDEFRWVVLRPTQGLRGLRQLLSASAGYRVDTVRTRGLPDGSDEAVEAKRRENAMWRLWWRDGGPAGSGLLGPAEPSQRKGSGDSVDLSPLSDAEELLGAEGADLQPAWRVATAAAKEGDVTEARRENLAWRKWHMAGSGQGSSPSSAES